MTDFLNSSNLTTAISSSSSQDNQNLPYAALCFVAIIANTLVILTISFDKNLHNKSQFVLLSLSVGEIFFNLSSAGVGIIKYFSISSTQFDCILRHYPLLSSGSVVKNLMLALAVDRWLCMQVPLFYRNLNVPRYIACLNAICWAHGLGVNATSFIKYDRSVWMPVCTLSLAVDKRFLVVTQIEDNLITLITIIIYPALASVFFRRYRREKVSSLIESKEWRRQMDFDVFISMMIVGCVYSFNAFPSFAMIMGYSSMSAGVLGAIQTFSLFFILFCSLSHLIVYYKVNKLFRKGFAKVICRKKNTIGQFGGGRTTSMGGATGASTKRNTLTLASVG